MSQKVASPSDSNAIDKKPKKTDKHKILLKEVKKTPSKGGVRKSDAGIKKPHRFRPGTVAAREIRKYQKSTELLIPKVAVYRLVKDILAEQGHPELRLSKKAAAYLQLALEEETLKQMQITNDSALHAGRITIQPKDMQHANRVRDTHPGATFATGGSGGVVMPQLYQEHDGGSSKKVKKEKKSKKSGEEETTVDSTTTTH